MLCNACGVRYKRTGSLELASARKVPLRKAPCAADVKRGCTYCGATSTPQWRHHPETNAMLCNACGVRYKKTGSLELASARKVD